MKKNVELEMVKEKSNRVRRGWEWGLGRGGEKILDQRSSRGRRYWINLKLKIDIICWLMSKLWKMDMDKQSAGRLRELR